ncbi:hypothetical protein BDP81DRAFT_82056 [Colletotrichum phormii]|uniref:Uncharacterized protein n=1 Tax=Colletotrichum phormii TaxID=359342 RepID=A0AAJ0EM91_9PEZI|nr:uncharacterized protein BDP81DRAFT_82056 [Colletotrichum phormii]KAK1654364.1 hypothetical protein BDP81DRAFT_82056 [Colletotrichum phormii]
MTKGTGAVWPGDDLSDPWVNTYDTVTMQNFLTREETCKKTTTIPRAMNVLEGTEQKRCPFPFLLSQPPADTLTKLLICTSCDARAMQPGASVSHRSLFGTVIAPWCCEPETHKEPRVSSLSKARCFSWFPFLFSYSTPRLLPRQCLPRLVSQNPDLVYTRKSRGGRSHGRGKGSIVDEPCHRAARLSNFLFRNKYLWRCSASECPRIGMPRGLTPKLVRGVEQFEIVIYR